MKVFFKSNFFNEIRTSKKKTKKFANLIQKINGWNLESSINNDYGQKKIFDFHGTVDSRKI
jgi:hypothetical protein